LDGAIRPIDEEVNEMSEWSWILIAVVVLVVVLAILVGLLMGRRRRSARLKEQFGPEYDRTVGELGEQRAAEAELLAREKKRKKLDIISLTPDARREHAATWAKVQEDFVDDPQDAVGRAERLVTRVMRERGYPIDDFDQRAADISVDHPDIVDNYRSAHAIYLSQHNGEISTEDARQAFVHYRALFERLLASDPGTETEVQGREQRRQTHDHA
jgi:type VI protein secretion system component VasK